MRASILAVVILMIWAGSAQGTASYTLLLAAYCGGYWSSVARGISPLFEKQKTWISTHCPMGGGRHPRCSEIISSADKNVTELLHAVSEHQRLVNYLDVFFNNCLSENDLLALRQCHAEAQETDVARKQAIQDLRIAQDPNQNRQSAEKRLSRCLDPNALPF